jgi:TRAP-type C4-dicarboxylate transport system substrate-binding protein
MNRTASFVASVVLAAVLGVAILAVPAAAQAPVTVKMATLVPENSSWFNVLKDVADKWNKASGGKVRVILYAGGRQGDDPDVVRKMNLGSLNAGVLTSVGVAEIDKSVYALGIPMAFDSYEEVYAVLDKMRPRLESTLEAKGYVVLNWADGGWVQFFGKTAFKTPDDMRKMKLFVWAGDIKTVEIWKQMKFDPRPAPSTEIVTGLQTGLFEVFGAPPQVAVITRYYENAKFMLDMKWGLLLGATVIKKDVWERIPAELRPQLLQIARDAGAKLQSDIRLSGQRDVDAMKKAGLTVITPDAATIQLWKKTAESAYPQIRGGVVPEAAFDEALKFRDEYRKQKASAPAAPKK